MAFYLSVAVAELSDDEERALEFLQSFPRIRLYIASSPQLGHQSASVTILNRLRELGYTGKIQVVYVRGEEQKLAVLIPGFSAVGPSLIADRGLEFITTQDLMMGPSSPVEFTITGGTDNAVGADADLVRRLQTRLMLKLHPQNYPGKEGIFYRPGGGHVGALEDVHYAKGFGPVGFSETRYLNSYYFKQTVPTLTPLSEPLATLQSNEFGPKSALVDELLDIVRNENSGFDLAPVYGLLPVGYSDIPLLANYLTGLRKAIRANPQAFRKNGVIVPVFNELNETQTKELLSVIADLNRDGVFPPIRVRTPTRRTFPGISWRKPFSSLYGSIRKTPSIEVSLVGHIPKSKFELIFSSASVAPLAEGKATGSLLRTAGCPYVQSGGVEDWSNPNGSTLASLNERARDLMERAQREMIGGPGSARGTAAIAELILATKDPTSELRQYFAYLKGEAHSVKNDKVVQGLRAARAIYESNNWWEFGEALEKVSGSTDIDCRDALLRASEAKTIKEEKIYRRRFDE